MLANSTPLRANTPTRPNDPAQEQRQHPPSQPIRAPAIPSLSCNRMEASLMLASVHASSVSPARTANQTNKRPPTASSQQLGFSRPTTNINNPDRELVVVTSKVMLARSQSACSQRCSPLQMSRAIRWRAQFMCGSRAPCGQAATHSVTIQLDERRRAKLEPNQSRVPRA